MTRSLYLHNHFSVDYDTMPNGLGLLQEHFYIFIYVLPPITFLVPFLECDCDFCDPDTGVCKCPPNTAGADCTCVKGTFGYDPVQGCLACDCDPTGVTDSSGSCDTTSGQCSCLPSRAGRRCDQCKPGYYDFPNCKKCDCNEDGISGCDPETGRCICKVSSPMCGNSIFVKHDSCIVKIGYSPFCACASFVYIFCFDLQ